MSPSTPAISSEAPGDKVRTGAGFAALGSLWRGWTYGFLSDLRLAFVSSKRATLAPLMHSFIGSTGL